jgi:C-terminal processing protease CtpA/Prc
LRDNDGGEGRYGAELLSYLLDKPVRTTESIDTPRTRYSFLEYTEKGLFFNSFHPRLWERKDSSRYVLKGNWRRTIAPKALRFESRVFVLINGMSISATSGFAALAHHHKRAVFIGEETGGAYYSDNGGDFLKLTLPCTGLRVNIPLRSYTMRVPGYPHLDRGVLPDFEVAPKIEDILKGRDTILQFVLDLLIKNQD